MQVGRVDRLSLLYHHLESLLRAKPVREKVGQFDVLITLWVEVRMRQTELTGSRTEECCRPSRQGGRRDRSEFYGYWRPL